MAIADEILEFLIAHDNQQSGSRDRNIELFMYHFGFMNAAWPIYEETGREYGHSKQNANDLVDTILSIFKLQEQPLPSIQKFVGIISSIKIIRTSVLTQILIEKGLVNSPDACNIKGLLRLIDELGCQHNICVLDFNLSIIKRKDYSPNAESILIDRSIINEIKKGTAVAKGLSGDLGLVSCSYLIEQLGDKYEYSNEVCDLITHKVDNTCFTMDDGEVFFHIGGFQNDGLLNSFGKAFQVNDEININQLADALRRPIQRRQAAKKIIKLLPPSIVIRFIETFKDAAVLDDKVSFTGEKKGLNELEASAEQFLKKSGLVRISDLMKYLSEKSFSKEYRYAETNYSPIFSKFRGKNGETLISLIGTEINTLPLALSFDDIVERIEAQNKSARKFQNMLDEAAKSGAWGEDIVNSFLEQRKTRDEIFEFKWVSTKNPGAPCDFVIQENDGGVSLVDVKSTKGNFDNEIHISFLQLCMMRDNEQYFIYRVYQINDKEAGILLTGNMKNFAIAALQWIESVPFKFTIDSICVKPSLLGFDNEIRIPIK